MQKIRIFIILIFSTISAYANSHDTTRMNKIRQTLDTLVFNDPAYMAETDISVGGISLNEMLRDIALVNKLNVIIKDGGNTSVSCNFTGVRIDDLLYYLCKTYNLNISIAGNIVTVYSDSNKIPSAETSIKYSSLDSTLTVDFTEVPLHEIIKVLSREAGINIIVDRGLYEKKLTAYLLKSPLIEALSYMSKINGLCVEWIDATTCEIKDNSNGALHNFIPDEKKYSNNISSDSSGRVSVVILNGRMQDIIAQVCSELGLNYHFISPLNMVCSVFLTSVDADYLFASILKGTQYTYYEENSIYFFGGAEGYGNMLEIEVIPLKYRAVDQVITAIPRNLAENVQVNIFAELNSIVLCGDSREVSRVISFLKEIDKPVPLITIDIIIVESSKNRNREIGLSYGKGEESINTSGKLSPGIDLTMGAGTINKLINDFNGFGSIKLGHVSPHFYAGLKILEANGDIIVESTPKLSTLNGREAILTSGETQYYKEVNNNYIGTESPMQSTSYIWKSIDANLSIKIVPYISSDSLITMDIDISQSEFTARVEKDAPPGIALRSFKSIIRVSDNEMVLLGGIDKNSQERSSSGLPWVGRIPILKWFLGNSRNYKNENKLNVFIKPTIIE